MVVVLMLVLPVIEFAVLLVLVLVLNPFRVGCSPRNENSFMAGAMY